MAPHLLRGAWSGVRTWRRLAAAAALALSAVATASTLAPHAVQANAGDCVFGLSGLPTTFTPAVTDPPPIGSPVTSISGSGTCIDLAILDTVSFSVSLSGILTCAGGEGDGGAEIQSAKIPSPLFATAHYVAGPGTMVISLVNLQGLALVGTAELAWNPVDTALCPLHGTAGTNMSGSLTFAQE